MKTTTLLAAVMMTMATGVAGAEPIGVGAPLEVNLQIHQGAVALDFDTVAEKYYQIEFSQDLVTWDREGYAFKGTGGRMSKVASGRGLARGYYRLRDDGDPQNVATGNPVRVWIDEKANRTPGAIYTNGFPYEIGVAMRLLLTGPSLLGRAAIQTRRDGNSAWMLVAGAHPDETSRSVDMNATIPAGWQYRVVFDLNTDYTVQSWNELK